MARSGKRVRRREGDILKINLGDGRHSYAQVAGDPVLVFFDGAFAEDMAAGDVPHLPVLFRVWVHDDAIKSGRWSVVGNQRLTGDNATEPFFYKQDTVTGGLSLYHSRFAETGWERPASVTECEGLECAAVWEPGHVEDRLRDHYAGRSNVWLESL